jgi:hypothetical protein
MQPAPASVCLAKAEDSSCRTPFLLSSGRSENEQKKDKDNVLLEEETQEKEQEQEQEQEQEEQDKEEEEEVEKEEDYSHGEFAQRMSTTPSGKQLISFQTGHDGKEGLYLCTCMSAYEDVKYAGIKLNMYEQMQLLMHSILLNTV